jgi:RNA polymerase sigma-70 factor (ECF subfamily)
MIDLDVHLAAIQAGDAGAFGSWLAGAELPVRDTLRSFAHVVDVEAVLQEALLRVWQVAPRFTPDGKPNSLLRLAVRVARNLAISERRRTREAGADDEALERALAAEEGDPLKARAPVDPMLRRVIEGCRDALPEKPRQALGARLECAGADPDELLAERLGMRKNTFLQNFTRARKLLEECLEQHGVDVRAELV